MQDAVGSRRGTCQPPKVILEHNALHSIGGGRGKYYTVNGSFPVAALRGAMTQQPGESSEYIEGDIHINYWMGLVAPRPLRNTGTHKPQNITSVTDKWHHRLLPLSSKLGPEVLKHPLASVPKDGTLAKE